MRTVIFIDFPTCLAEWTWSTTSTFIGNDASGLGHAHERCQSYTFFTNMVSCVRLVLQSARLEVIDELLKYRKTAIKVAEVNPPTSTVVVLRGSWRRVEDIVQEYDN